MRTSLFLFSLLAALLSPGKACAEADPPESELNTFLLKVLLAEDFAGPTRETVEKKTLEYYRRLSGSDLINAKLAERIARAAPPNDWRLGFEVYSGGAAVYVQTDVTRPSFQRVSVYFYYNENGRLEKCRTAVRLN